MVELGIFSVMWSEHCSYKSSKVWLEEAADQGAVGDPGPGRERRRGRHRRRPGRHLQDGEPQPPLLHRALPGRGDRRRRHPARRLHHGRAAGRQPQCAALRRSQRIPRRAIWCRGVVAGIGGYGNCMGMPTVGGETNFHRRLQRQHPGQRHDRRHRADATGSSTPPPRASAIRWSMSAPRPGATASTAPPWPRPSSTRTARRSARPCRSAIRSSRSCCSRPASS